MASTSCPALLVQGAAVLLAPPLQAADPRPNEYAARCQRALCPKSTANSCNSFAFPSPLRTRPLRQPAARASSAKDFFQADVVEYGSRYNRPDRFPRLKQADRARRDANVLQWLAKLCHVAEVHLGFPALAVPDCAEAVSSDAGVAAARQVLLLTKQGRLDEAYRVLEAWKAKESRAGAGEASLTPSQFQLDHSAFLLAAVGAGDVALAFEYAGILEARIAWYDLLCAAYAVRGDLEAVRLGLSTAARRGIAAGPLTFLIGAAAAAGIGEDEQALSFFAVAERDAGIQGTASDVVITTLASL